MDSVPVKTGRPAALTAKADLRAAHPAVHKADLRRGIPAIHKADLRAAHPAVHKADLRRGIPAIHRADLRAAHLTVHKADLRTALWPYTKQKREDKKEMKETRKRRFLYLLMAVCLLAAAMFSYGKVDALAEAAEVEETDAEVEETDAEAEETDAAETEANEIDTEEAETKEADVSEEEAEEPVYTIDNIRDFVVGLDAPVELADGTIRPMINFDNAATTPALQPVMDEVDEKLVMYGSIGRGYSQKSNYSTDLYNETRKKVLDFVGADEKIYTCFYSNNTTDGLNKLASALIETGDEVVLCTRMEHHANDLPWRERCNVIYEEVDEFLRILDEILPDARAEQEKMNEKDEFSWKY